MNWNPSVDVIQLSFGRGIVNLMTSPDNRNVLEKFIGTTPPPKSGDLIGTYIVNFRAYLSRKNLLLPRLTYYIDENIEPYRYDIYIGFEGFTGVVVQNIQDVFNTIETLLQRYDGYYIQENTYKSKIDACILDIKNDDFQYAFDKYKYIYYYAKLHSKTYEEARCLNDCSLIFLKNMDYYRSSQAILEAIRLSNVMNFVDVNLKSQIFYNAGLIAKAGNYLNDSYNYYFQSLTFAQQINNAPQTFLSYTALGDVAALLGDYKNAIAALRCAQGLLLQSNSNYDIALHIERQVSFLEKQQIHQTYHISQNNKANHVQSTVVKSSLIDIDTIIRWFVQTMIKVGVETAVYKIIGVSNKPLLSIFGKLNYEFNDKTIFVENATNLRLK